MPSRAIEDKLSRLIEEDASVETIKTNYEALALPLKNKQVGKEVLHAAIKSKKHDVVKAIVDVSEEVNSTDLSIAFWHGASEEVLNVLEMSLKPTKIPALMNQLMDIRFANRETRNPIECFERAYNRYKKPPSPGCWAKIFTLPEEAYLSWTRVLEDKVKYPELGSFEVKCIVDSTWRDGSWEARLTLLESKGCLPLSSLKSARSEMRYLPPANRFDAFVSTRVRKEGAKMAAITKKRRLALLA
jgi:hypothetical protein